MTIKLGGSILEDTKVRARLLAEISKLRKQNHELIVVHGGGKSLSRRLSQLNLPSRFVDGLRVTDAETLEVAVMVLAGEVNKRIVAEMDRLGAEAVGICGADAGAVRCVRLSDLPGQPKGLGFVGKAVAVNRSFFDLILGCGAVPVVSSIALGPDGQLYNVNADQMAAACASDTSCRSVVYLTDVPGVMDQDGSVLNRLGTADIMNLRSQGALSGGMLPKTGACLEAIAAGVRCVHIMPGSSPDVLSKCVDGTIAEGTTIDGNQ